jgi:outer membrane protein assembly factor BamB
VGGAPSLGGPVVANGTVVVAVGDEDGGGRLVGLDAADGGRRWDWEAGAAIKHRPTAGGDDVFAITVIGTVVRLDAATGAVRWSTQLGDASHRWCSGAPTVDGHVVYAGGASSFAALDRADGRVLWERADLAADDWMPIRAAPAPADDLVVFAFANEHVQLAAVDVATGATRWLRGGHELTAPWSSPVVHDGRVIVPTIAGWLVARDLATGATCWRSSLGAAWSAATPLVVDDMVLTTSSDGVLHAFDARDGSPRWSSPLGSPWRARLPYGRAPGGSSCSPVRVAADVAVVGPAGEVWRVDLASGELTTVADAEGPVAASPAAGTDTIYVAAEHGVVEAFEAFKAFTP